MGRHTLDVADGRYFAAAPLLLPASFDDDRQVGHVFLYEGSPSWLLAVLEPSAGRGEYQVVVTMDGVDRPAGRCVLTSTGCAVGHTIRGSIRDVDRVRLVGPGGAHPVAEVNRQRPDRD